MQTRSFCYVNDLIDALVRLMNTADEVTGPVNLGNPQELTILQLALTLVGFTGMRKAIEGRIRKLMRKRHARHFTQTSWFG
jgi:UDP-glucuronate decarboxylase